MICIVMDMQCNANLERITPQKLACKGGEPKAHINPTLESHASNVGLKSHTLQQNCNTVFDIDALCESRPEEAVIYAFICVFIIINTCN